MLPRQARWRTDSPVTVLLRCLRRLPLSKPQISRRCNDGGAWLDGKERLMKHQSLRTALACLVLASGGLLAGRLAFAAVGNYHYTELQTSGPGSDAPEVNAINAGGLVVGDE